MVEVMKWREAPVATRERISGLAECFRPGCRLHILVEDPSGNLETIIAERPLLEIVAGLKAELRRRYKREKEIAARTRKVAPVSPDRHSLGGQARADNLTPARRAEIASTAAKARWGRP